MKTVVKTHSRNPLHRRRKRIPAKKRNEVAIMADYNRRPCKSSGHKGAKANAYLTNCVSCGVPLSWSFVHKRWIIR